MLPNWQSALVRLIVNLWREGPSASASVACFASIRSEMPTALVLRRLPLRVVGCNTYVEPWRRPPEGARFVSRVENQAAVPSTP